MSANKRFWLAVLLPLERFVAFFSRPKYKIKTPEIEKVIPLDNGTILVSKTDYELSNTIIPGWKHCAVYYRGYVYEATLKGVQKVLLQLWLGTRDHVGIVKPLIDLPEALQAQGYVYLESKLGEPYDYGFDLDSDVINANSPRIFCSGYVYGWLKSMNPDFVTKFELTDTGFEKTIEPDYFWTATEFFKQITRIN